MQTERNRRNVRRKRLESAQKYHLAAINQLYKIRRESKAKKRESGNSRNQPGRNQSSRKGARRRIVA